MHAVGRTSVKGMHYEVILHAKGSVSCALTITSSSRLRLNTTLYLPSHRDVPWRSRIEHPRSEVCRKLVAASSIDIMWLLGLVGGRLQHEVYSTTEVAVGHVRTFVHEAPRSGHHDQSQCAAVYQHQAYRQRSINLIRARLATTPSFERFPIIASCLYRTLSTDTFSSCF